jgi:hypothetical protein
VLFHLRYFDNGASAENLTPLIGPAIRGAHPIYRARSRHTSCDTFQLSKIYFRHTTIASLRTKSKLDKWLNLPTKTKKRGLPLLVAAPFLKSVCYSKTVRSPRTHHD